MAAEDKQTKLNESALWMVTQEPVLNDFVIYLNQKKQEILANPEAEHVLKFSQSKLDQARQAFGRMILRGESRLHKLCGVLADDLFQGNLSLQSVVVGRVDHDNHFTLSQTVSQEDIYERTDLDLGNWLLAKLRYQSANSWTQPELVANFVEYQPLAGNRFDIHKMISRIKAEEEIWAKTVDEIFELDKLVSRDKELRKLSFYIKDVFGIKMIVSHARAVEQVLNVLKNRRWSGEILARQRVPDLPMNRKLEILEIKDHMGPELQKASGWQALKVVVSWWGKVFELQIQPLENYLREREYLTQESHANFKERRERIRQEVVAKIPLFGFYLELLKWFFIDPGSSMPKMKGVTIQIHD